jgi:general transcription factor 3C protein 4
MRLTQFRFKDASLEHVVTTKVSAEWITHLALSFWSSPKAGESTIGTVYCSLDVTNRYHVGEITLAFGAADGSVGSVKIIQTLSSAPSSSGFCLDYTIETRVEKSDSTIFPPHNTGMTALSWIFPGENVRINFDSPSHTVG